MEIQKLLRRLELGEIIAVEGAAYLTDEAKVNITQN